MTDSNSTPKPTSDHVRLMAQIIAVRKKKKK